MQDWAVDKKERGVNITKVPKGNIYLKTSECGEIVKQMTANKETLDAAAAMKASTSTENLAAVGGAASEPAEEGVPPAGAAEDGSPAVRPPRDDEEQI